MMGEFCLLHCVIGTKYCSTLCELVINTLFKAVCYGSDIAELGKQGDLID